MYALMPGRAGRGMTFGGGHFRHQIGPFFLFFFSGGGRILLAGAPQGGYGCLGSKRDRCNVIPPMLLKYTCSSFSHCCRLGLKYAGTVQKLGWLDMQVGLLFLPFATFEKRLVRLYVLVRLKIIKNSNNKE